jgi:hypothetical protein
MLFLILSLLIQAALIVHVIRTGRNTLWIWAIALLPAAGPLAYVVVELLPSLFAGAAARRARASVQRAIDPDRDLRHAAAQVALSANVEARRRLADELLERGQFDAAIAAYAAGLTGIFEHDPTLLLGLARAQFAKGEFSAARESLDRLIKENPDFKSAEGHLLYARALEAEGALERAESEYAALQGSYPGAEGRVRYALLLKRLGRNEEANQLLREILQGAELAPRHYRKAQAQWLERARRELVG